MVQMRGTLLTLKEQTFKKFPKPLYQRYCQVAVDTWRADTAKKLTEIANNPEEWLDQNELKIAKHYDYGTNYAMITFEDVLQFFIQKVFLEALE